MRNRRGIAFLIAGIGILILLVLVAIFILQPGQPAVPDPPVAVNGTPVPVNGEPLVPEMPAATIDPQAEILEVVVSLQTLPRGYVMTEADLTTDMRLASEVSANVITNIQDAVGLYARRDIYQGETLTLDSLARNPLEIGRENFGPSSIIPPGWLAMALPMDRLSSVAYGISAGDTVDVMVSWIFYEVDEEFQTLMRNSVSFIMEVADEEGNITRTVLVVDPYGRFERLPNQDLAHVFPSEEGRPVPVTMVIQNARVIQIGPWEPPPPPALPTPTLDPGAPTPTPDPALPTPTPQAPDVLVLALPPQQQLILKYAVDSHADIDFALRGVGDGQQYGVENVDLFYMLEQFNIVPPPGINYSIQPVEGNDVTDE